jgi:hypothetical protein
MVESHAFRFPISDRAESPNASIYTDLRVSLSGPAGTQLDETSMQPKIQLAQYIGHGSRLEELILRGLQNGGRRSQSAEEDAEEICRARHMPFNECYRFKQLDPRDQDKYDHLHSNRDREDFLRDRGR